MSHYRRHQVGVTIPCHPVKSGGCFFVAAALPLVGGTASPVRPIAIL